MTKRALRPMNVVLLFILLLTAIAGCTTHSSPPAFDPAHIPGYQGLQEEFGNLDFSPLRNRSIVIDPGHGGFFRGATGPEGLTEAEVNLGVALYLRGLLEWAGAQVFLTRTADYDFLSLADSTLSTDLAFRTSFTDSIQPDVFISIHHNSTASRDPEINETQTYYPLGDDGASLDLARSIHRHLVLNLEITPAKILPGNFYVLRNATVPAVLGEPAMISNPVMEGRLSLAASHDLEAKAYFLGLLDYFSAGQPRFSGPDTVRINTPIPEIYVTREFLTAAAGQPSGPLADPSSFMVTLNGKPQGFDLSADGRRVTWSPGGPIPGGTSVLCFSGRNIRGRATPIAKTVIISSPAPGLSITYTRESTQNNPAPRTMIFWQNQADAEIAGRFLNVNGKFSLLLPPRNQGWFLLPADVGPTPFFELHTPNAEYPIALDATRGPAMPPHFRWRLLTIGEAPVFASSLMPPMGWHNRLFNPGIGHGNAMLAAGSPAFAWQPGPFVWIEAKGVLPLIHTSDSRTDRRQTFSLETPIIRPRLLLHQLFGKTIILDPAGGGTNNNGTYTLGTRGSDLNLETARQVRLLLEGAGARVLLTREAEVAPDPQQKVLLAGTEKADLFLTIARAMPGEPSKVQHHPGSRVGELWANAMTVAMAPMDSLGLETSYAYLLRHTACPALEIQLKAPEDAQEEMLQTSLPWHMAEARAILLACATALSPQGQRPPVVIPELILNQLSDQSAGLSLPSVQRATWDGNFNWVSSTLQTPPNTVDSWQATGWPAVATLHTLEIHSGSQWQIWRVDFQTENKDEAVFNLIMENR